jgi:hypothetical protein
MSVKKRDSRRQSDSTPYKSCGVQAGDRLRLKRGFVERDHKGRARGKRHCFGEIWTVLDDACRDHDAIWLREPDGTIHTWDESLFDTFSLLAMAPRKGSRVRLRRMPNWVKELPKESKDVFRYCLHHASRVEGVDDHGLIELLLTLAADRHFGGVMNSIYVEAEYSSPSARRK